MTAKRRLAAIAVIATSGTFALAFAPLRRGGELASASKPGPAKSGAKPATWDEFPVFVWFAGGPKPGPASFAVLAKHGLGGCNVEGSDASDASEAAHAAGVNFYVDHAAGKGDLYLRQNVVDEDHKALLADLVGFRPKRPNCFDDPNVVERLERRLDDSVKRHASHEPKGYVLDDELSISRGVNPIDYCYCDFCLAKLREFVAKRYGDVAKLDRAWGANFRSWKEVVPPTTEETRRVNAGRPLSKLDFTAWSDHLEAMDAAFRETIDRLCERSRRLDPKTPVGYTGGQFPSAFGGFQWDTPLEHLSLVELYESGVAPELVRAAQGFTTKVVSTVFVPDKPAERASWSPFEVLARMGRGDDGAVVWSAGAIFDASGEELDEAGRSLAAAVREAAKLRARLAAEHALPIAPSAAPVMLFENAPSVRAAWMVDSWPDGKTWPNRLTSYEATHSSSATSREGWATLLRAAGVPYGFLWPRELDEKSLAARGVAAIVLHECLALSDAQVGALEKFVRGGGLLVADTHVALFDEQLHGRDAGALARLFGVARRGDPGVAELAKELDFASTAGGATSGAPNEVERASGSGTTLFLGRRVAGLPDDPRRRAALLELAPKISQWLAAHGVKESPRLPLDVAGKLRLHRWRAASGAVKGDGRGEEFALVVATAPAREAIASNVRFDRDVDVEWIEPQRAKVERVPANSPLAIEVDDEHAVLLRWRPTK